MIDGGDIVIRCDACGDEIAVYVSMPKGELDRDELKNAIEDDGWFTHSPEGHADIHYCPVCEQEWG